MASCAQQDDRPGRVRNRLRCKHAADWCLNTSTRSRRQENSLTLELFCAAGQCNYFLTLSFAITVYLPFAPCLLHSFQSIRPAVAPATLTRLHALPLPSENFLPANMVDHAVQDATSSHGILTAPSSPKQPLLFSHEEAPPLLPHERSDVGAKTHPSQELSLIHI